MHVAATRYSIALPLRAESLLSAIVSRRPEGVRGNLESSSDFSTKLVLSV